MVNISDQTPDMAWGIGEKKDSCWYCERPLEGRQVRGWGSDVDGTDHEEWLCDNDPSCRVIGDELCRLAKEKLRLEAPEFAKANPHLFP